MIVKFDYELLMINTKYFYDYPFMNNILNKYFVLRNSMDFLGYIQSQTNKNENDKNDKSINRF